MHRLLRRALQGAIACTAAVTVTFGGATAVSASPARPATVVTASSSTAQPQTAAVTATSAASATNCRRVTLRFGSKNTCVTYMQRRLYAHGYMPSWLFTGTYGYVTRDVVQAFQLHKGLSPDGVVGPKTWAAIVGKLTVHQVPTGCARKVAVLLCTTKRDSKVRLFMNGYLQATMDARFGDGRPREWDSKAKRWKYFKTPEGSFTVRARQPMGVSKKYGDAKMPWSLWLSKQTDVAIHYSARFAREGYSNYSHGCINLRAYYLLEEVFWKADIGSQILVYSKSYKGASALVS